MIEHRPVSREDADALHRVLSDPGVAFWLRAADESGPFTLEECERIISEKVAHWTAHGFGMSLAWEQGACVGRSVVQHTIANGHSEVEIGWTVARDRWGEGIATELGRQALSVASSVGARQVVAFTRRDNGASRRVMDKLGLEYELDFEHAGLPHVLYRTPA